jgi:hypothetical protein
MNPLLSGSVMAASMLLGQTPDPPALPPLGGGKVIMRDAAQPPIIIQQTQGASAQQPSPQRPLVNWFNREDRPIITKIQSWFKRDAQTPPNPQQPPFIQPASNGKVREEPPMLTQPLTPSTTTPADFPRKLPNPSSKTIGQTSVIGKDSQSSEKGVQQTALQQSPTARNAKSPILRQWIEKIGRDEKFEWITGQLELENGAYVIYYASPETVDKFHGRIVLVPQQVDMKSFRRGDLISLHGQLGQRQSLQGTTPTYRLTDATLIERPKL